MKIGIYLLMLFLFSSKSNTIIKEDSISNSIHFSDSFHQKLMGHHRTMQDDSNCKVENVFLIKETELYSFSIKYLKVKNPNLDFGRYISFVFDSLVKSQKGNFNSYLQFYTEDKNRLNLLKEDPATFHCDYNRVILNKDILSFTIEEKQNFPLGTMFPFQIVNSFNYSVKRKEPIYITDLMDINNTDFRDNVINQLTEYYTGVENMTVDMLVKLSSKILKEGDKIQFLLKEEELELYFFQDEEQNSILLPYDLIYPQIKQEYKYLFD